MLAKIFLSIINIIGPIKVPTIPINLNPVYIEINVNIGWIPICPDTTFGSSSCFTIDIIASNTIRLTPSVKSPLHAQIMAQGIITADEPKIGSASTKPIPRAASNGYWIFNPIILKRYNPY